MARQERNGEYRPGQLERVQEIIGMARQARPGETCSGKCAAKQARAGPESRGMGGPGRD